MPHIPTRAWQCALSLSQGTPNQVKARRIRSAGNFASLDTGRADVQPLGSARYDCVHPLDVGVPTAVGLLLRPGDVVAESRPLAAYVAYRSHWNPLPNYVDTDEVPEVGQPEKST